MNKDELFADGTHQRIFLFTDVVDSVSFKTKFGNAAYKVEYGWIDEILQKTVEMMPGAKILQDFGDGRLCTFGTSSSAVQAALVLQYRLANRTWLFEPLTVRVGIHAGEVNRGESGSFSGLAIDTAARVMGLAGARQILMTRTIYDDARAYVLRHPSIDGQEVDIPLRWASHGEYVLKGLGKPHEIFEIFAEGIGPGQPPPNSEKARRVDSDNLSWRPKPGEPIPFKTPTWTLKQSIGAGSFGEVWLAERGTTQNVFKFCFDAERLVALRREVDLFGRMHSMLGDRTDIQHVLDYHFDDAPPYYVQYEYAAGGSLADWMQLQGGIDQVPLEERLDIVRQVALGLDAAHAAGVLHLDIKPANILMRKDGHGGWQPVLADFGMGKVNSEVLAQQKSQTMSKAIAVGALDTSGGTMAYMAPELIDLKPATTRSDIYSLGVLLYQMTVGTIKALAPGWEYDVNDPLLQHDIADCVAGDPERRLRSAHELADRLASLPKRRRRQARRRIRNWASVGLLILAAGVIAVLLQRSYERERRLKQAASELFKESVGTMRAVFNEALSDELRDLPESVHLRQSLIEYCQSFASQHQSYLAEFPDYDTLFEEFGDDIRAFDPQMAATLYERAIEHQDQVRAQGRKIPPARIPELHIKRGEVRTELGDRGAQAELEEAAEALATLLVDEPESAPFRFLLGQCYHNLADNYHALDAQHDKAIEYYLLSQGYFEWLVRRFCGDETTSAKLTSSENSHSCARYQQALARSHGYQGDLYLEQGNLEKAKLEYDAALEIRARLVEQEPTNDQRRFELARSYQNSGRLASRLGDVDEALSAFEKARDMQLELHAEKGSVLKYKTDLVYTCRNIAELNLDKGDLPAAKQAAELAARLITEIPDSYDGIEASSSVALVLARLGVQENSPDAAKLVDEARRRLQQFIAQSVGPTTSQAPIDEQIKDCDQVYDLAVVDALAAASSTSQRDLQSREAIKLLRKAIAKGYRDVARFERDKAFGVLSDAERAEIANEMRSPASLAQRGKSPGLAPPASGQADH
jgi:serine/threonine protein kinase/class 3 adenylate cyclase